MAYGFKIIVEGDYACYTRSEFKVERVSYDVPTPGALEGMLKSVYWKPAIRYVIDKIVVFNPICFVNIKRNEVSEKISYSKINQQMNGKDADTYLYAGDVINQRTSMVLKNVKYGIEFHFELTGIRSEKSDEGEDKHYNIIMRRLKNGQCFRQPCLGCREFSVKSLKLVEDIDISTVSQELKGTRDLGYMLYGMKFADGGIPIKNNWAAPKFIDKADALYYRPIMVDGVIDVAKYRKGMMS